MFTKQALSMYITSAKAVMFICADNVLRQRGLLRSLCHDIYLYMGVYVSMIKGKPLNGVP